MLCTSDSRQHLQCDVSHVVFSVSISVRSSTLYANVFLRTGVRGRPLGRSARVTNNCDDGANRGAAWGGWEFKSR